jgi:hypothetical protein
MTDKGEIVLLDTMLAPSAISERSHRIHDIMKEAMRPGIDYGTIPGCGSKPTLLKAGAEKLMMAFQIAAKLTVTDLSTAEECRYRTITSMYSQGGVFLGDGVGEASSAEEKYAWKEVSPEEWEATPETQRRLKYAKDGQSTKKQIRTNPADQANTVLKMSAKRSRSDGVLSVLGASDIFTQDLEDKAEDRTATVENTEPVSGPSQKPKPQEQVAKPKDGDAVTTTMLAWLEKNAHLVWTAEEIDKWLAGHKVQSFAALTCGDARDLHKQLVTAFEDKTAK